MRRVVTAIVGFLVLVGLAACSGADEISPSTPLPVLPEFVTPSAPNYVTMNDTSFI